MPGKPTRKKPLARPVRPGEETLLDAAAVGGALERMCEQIAADLPGRALSRDPKGSAYPGGKSPRSAVAEPDCPVALVGLRSRGDELAMRLTKRLARSGRDLLHGTLDITLYRDDLSKRAVQPTVRATEIPFDLDGAFVILVDDVLHTGRTIRSALDALVDYGRPAVIRLAVLVDRGGRELPIAPDYVGAKLDLADDETRRVYLELTETDGQDRVYLK